jgi:hypothetical protein
MTFASCSGGRLAAAGISPVTFRRYVGQRAREVNR